MKSQFNLWTCFFTRSERGPLAPLIKSFDSSRSLRMTLRDYSKPPTPSMTVIGEHLSMDRPDLVLCGFDRPEMVPVAYAAYHKRLPIMQIFAGDIAGGAFDDADRFAISNYADLIFCADKRQKERVLAALDYRREIDDMPEVHVSGPTHFGDMRYKSPKADGWYSMVLYNPPSKATVHEIKEELMAVRNEIAKADCPCYWVGPNGDRNSEVVTEAARRTPGVTYLGGMERKLFLGLLQGAKVFIGNSSCMFYEAQYFKVPIKQVGMRNKYRETISARMLKGDACSLIVEKVEEWLTRRNRG